MVLYSELGGFRGIVWTDVVQFVLSLTGMAVLAWLFVDRFWDGNLANVFESLRRDDRQELLTTPGPEGFYTAPMLFSLCVFYGLWPICPPLLFRAISCPDLA
jgi:Na+/proline symporter